MAVTPPLGGGPIGQDSLVLSGRLALRLGSLATGVALVVWGLGDQLVMSLSELLERLGPAAARTPAGVHPLAKRWLMAIGKLEQGLRWVAHWLSRPVRAACLYTSRIDRTLLRIHHTLTHR